MPAERRSLRSNKSDTTNGERARSDSQNSNTNSKDKPTHSRTTSKSNKTLAGKAGLQAAKEMSGDKGRANGTEPVENGVNGTEDVEMGDESLKSKLNKDGDDEMTVVVPPTKGPKLAGEPGPEESGDVAMDGTDGDAGKSEVVDTKAKAVAGKSLVLHPQSKKWFAGRWKQPTNIPDLDIKGNFALLEKAVSQFDSRFTLRVLRSISSMRKLLSAELLAQVISETYSASHPASKAMLAALKKESTSVMNGHDMEVDSSLKNGKATSSPKEVLPEVDTYLSILVQIHLYDNKEIARGAKFSTELVDGLRSINRRTLDSLAAKVYFYYSMFYEQLAPLPPSPLASVISIRQSLLSALRTAVLRKDQDIQATTTTLLLRNYLSTSHISQADLLISHTEFPSAASNNQIARYLYYLGRIRAIQLSYSEAHEHLIGATRKSPTTRTAGGFYQQSTKLLVVVELLMGDIPDRALFRQSSLEKSLQPYMQLVQAVSKGDLEAFLNLIQTHGQTFRQDGTYTLILRLRQNVIKTGIRMMSLSYARISLRDICLRLGLDSEESAEYIVAKAIRDGVIEATLDHERGFMKSKDIGDVYATKEPGEAFHDRIRACLSLHDESVKVMFPEQMTIRTNANNFLGNALPDEPASSRAQECPGST